MKYSLELPAFSIDFDVDEVASNARSGVLPNGEQTIFAVSDISIRIGDISYLVITEFQVDNLIVMLDHLKLNFAQPQTVPDLEKLVPKGGICAWFKTYWHRIQQETVTEHEEAVYELLQPLSLVEDRNDGRIAIYRYSSSPIVEVSTRTHPGGKGLLAWCEFDPGQISLEVKGLEAKITSDLNGAKHGE